MRKKNRRGLIKIVAIIASMIVGVFAVSSVPIEGLLEEYAFAAPLGALFAGALLVSMFTVIIGTVFIGVLASVMPLWQIVLLAGVGSFLADVVLFFLFRNTVSKEMQPFLRRWRKKPFVRALHSKYSKWLIPLLGAVIMASPLPDEIGVGLLGASNISVRRFMILSFILDCLGILVITLSARAIT